MTKTLRQARPHLTANNPGPDFSKASNKECARWSQFKNGDREAFGYIYRQHILSLIAYGSRICPDREVLKDSIQELFVELWQSRANLSPTDSVKFYLFKALRYKLIRQEKQRHRHIHAMPSIAELLYGGDPDVDSHETEMVRREEDDYHAELLQKAIKRLTIRQQEAIQLRYYQGFSNDQIAELMEMHYQSVSNLLYNALNRLKEVVSAPDLISAILLSCLFFA